jgi:2'-5' RNA ligase
MALSSAAKPLRLFFALWPDERVRAALAALAANLALSCGGRATRSDNLHATLAFLGNVPAARVPEFERMAAALRGAQFELRLDVVEYWRHNRIVWCGAKRTPRVLDAFAAGMSEALRALDWPVDERPYVPHVTLLRNARCGPATCAPSLPPWRVREFVLAQSTSGADGVRYRRLARWPLQA